MRADGLSGQGGLSRSEGRSRYAEQGFLSLGPVLDAEAVAALQSALDDWARSATPGEYGLLCHNLWCELPPFRALVEQALVQRRVLELLQLSELVLFQDNMVWKVPGNPTEIQWHQDFSYWPLDRPLGVTTWLALDDADEARGAMSYIPGSHRWGERAPADFIRGSGQPRNGALPPLDPQGRPSVVAEARAGELLIHDPLVWHRSGPNRGVAPRRAWTANWVLPDTRWAPSHAPHPYNWSLSPVEGAPLEGKVFPRFRASAL